MSRSARLMHRRARFWRLNRSTFNFIGFFFPFEQQPASGGSMKLVLLLAGLTTMTHACAEDYYSSDHEVARARFRREATVVLQGQSRLFQVPNRDGGDLSVDYLYLPPQQKTERLIVVTSGVHGAEGFAGQRRD